LVSHKRIKTRPNKERVSTCRDRRVVDTVEAIYNDQACGERGRSCVQTRFNVNFADCPVAARVYT
jgi:hypothetical protein